MSSYVEKTRGQLNEKFKRILDDPENSYFKDLAVAGLGLKNSPQCSSTAESDKAACQSNLIDGLTTLAQKQALSPLMPSAMLTRMASLSDANFILQNDVYQGVVRELNTQAQTDLSNPELEKKIKEKIFPQIKSLIIDRVSQLAIPDDQKKFIVSKIKAIQYAGSNCAELNNTQPGQATNNGQDVASLLIPNAFYDHGRNTFKFCSGFLLQSTSEFQIAMDIGHELSHSIDPCQIENGPADLGFKYKSQGNLKKMESEFPLSNVISCLRSPRSVEARILVVQSPGQIGQVGGYGNVGGTYGGQLYPIPNGGAAYPMSGGVLNQDLPAPPKPDFCQQDQITESFAEWMGAEVLPKYIEQNYKLSQEQYRDGYANARRPNCWSYPDTSDSFNYDTHPSIGRRIDRILLVNPQIRKQMGCSPKLKGVSYCDPNKSPVDEDGVAPMPAEPTSVDGARSTR